MSNIVVNDDVIDMGDDEVGEIAANSDTNVHKYCTSNPWVDGAAIMAKKNYVAVKAVSDARKERKRKTTRFIVKKVEELRAESVSSIRIENTEVLLSPWTKAIQELEPNYYT